MFEFWSQQLVKGDHNCRLHGQAGIPNVRKEKPFSKGRQQTVWVQPFVPAPKSWFMRFFLFFLNLFLFFCFCFCFFNFSFFFLKSLYFATVNKLLFFYYLSNTLLRPELADNYIANFIVWILLLAWTSFRLLLPTALLRSLVWSPSVLSILKPPGCPFAAFFPCLRTTTLIFTSQLCLRVSVMQ